jgi:hypothetical protein
MTTTDKRPLIFESVASIRIICKVPTKSKLGTYSQGEVYNLAITRPGHHSRLPHSPSNKPLLSREVRFDKLVTGLLGLLGPIELDM